MKGGAHFSAAPRDSLSLAGYSELLFVESIITRVSLTLFLSSSTICAAGYPCCHWEFTRSEIKWLMMGTKWRLDRVYVTLRLCHRRASGLRGLGRIARTQAYRFRRVFHPETHLDTC